MAMGKAAFLVILASLTIGCASVPKAPPGWERHGGVLYCYGPLWSWSYGHEVRIWKDDPCRIDPCELRMPSLECLQEKTPPTTVPE